MSIDVTDDHLFSTCSRPGGLKNICILPLQPSERERQVACQYPGGHGLACPSMASGS